MSVIAFIEREGLLLLERRSDAPVWGLIAGRVDDETVAEALRRKVYEETGLAVTSQRPFGVFSDPTRIVSSRDGNVFSVVSFVYSVDVETFEGLRPSSESEELRFFERDELLDLDLPATQRHIIEQYISGATPPVLE